MKRLLSVSGLAIAMLAIVLPATPAAAAPPLQNECAIKWMYGDADNKTPEIRLYAAQQDSPLD